METAGGSGNAEGDVPGDRRRGLKLSARMHDGASDCAALHHLLVPTSCLDHLVTFTASWRPMASAPTASSTRLADGRWREETLQNVAVPMSVEDHADVLAPLRFGRSAGELSLIHI